MSCWCPSWNNNKPNDFQMTLGILVFLLPSCITFFFFLKINKFLFFSPFTSQRVSSRPHFIKHFCLCVHIHSRLVSRLTHGTPLNSSRGAKMSDFTPRIDGVIRRCILKDRRGLTACLPFGSPSVFYVSSPHNEVMTPYSWLVGRSFGRSVESRRC